MKPRVLFVNHTAVLGGAELFLRELAAGYGAGEVALFADGALRPRLAESGVPVQVLTGGAGVAKVTRGGKGLAQLLAGPGLLRLAWQVARRARGYDLIFANSQKSLAVGALAARFARKPLLWYAHDLLTREHFSAVNIRICRAAVWLGRARVVANSQATRAAFIAAGGSAARTSVIYNGWPEPPHVEPAPIREQLGIGSAPLVGHFSRLAPWKGQHLFIEALAQLPRVHGVLVGGPLFPGEGDYEQALRAQVVRLGLAGRVHFLGFQENVPALLAAVDVVAHTSVAPEPFGRVIVEGLLARKPVVATRGGGTGEIIENDVTGRLVSADDVRALADALHQMLANPIRSAALAQAGYTYARRQFSIDGMLGSFLREFRTINDGKHTVRRLV